MCNYGVEVQSEIGGDAFYLFSIKVCQGDLLFSITLQAVTDPAEVNYDIINKAKRRNYLRT